MKYGLDSYLLTAPYSLIISLLMFFGVFYLGKNFLIISKFEKQIDYISDINFQSLLFGSLLISIFFFPIFLFEINHLFLFKILSYVLIIFGFLLIYECKNLFKKNQIKINFFDYQEIFLVILVVSYFLLSLSPVTNADSLDYHIGVPLHILSNEGIFPSHNYFHAAAFGSGEMINMIGLIAGAEMFGPLVQFSGMLSIVGIIKKSKITSSVKNFLIIISLTTPVYIFLVTSSKPQLLYIGCNALAFSLIFFNDSLFLKKNIFKLLIIIFSLLLVPITAKFSFALSSGLLILVLTYKSYKEKFLKELIFISLSVFFIILFPQIIWRVYNYGGNIFLSIFPIPTYLFGYNALANSLTTCGYHGCFPYWILFPYSLAEFTECLGFGSLLIFFFKDYQNKKLKIIFLIILIYVIFAHKFGPNIARYYVDPLVWLSIAASRLNIRTIGIFPLIWRYIVYLQSLIILAGITFGIFSLSIGSLNEDLRYKVMKKKASGYSLHDWANKVLPNDSVVMTTHRSVSTLQRKVIYIDFMTYIDPLNKNSDYYFNLVKDSKPTHIIFYDNKKYWQYLGKCVGKLEYYGKNVGSHAGRNPFKDMKKYDGYIYSIDYKEFPDCVRN